MSESVPPGAGLHTYEWQEGSDREWDARALIG